MADYYAETAAAAARSVDQVYKQAQQAKTSYQEIIAAAQHHGRVLPLDASVRKGMPIARGVLDYFPRAIAEVAHVSLVGNAQHNSGEPMHWAKEKSTDEADCIARHLIERGGFDSDGLRHSAKLAWRALALLQRELDESGS